MKRLALSLLISLSLISPLHGVEKQYAMAKVVDIQQKANTRVLYYIVNTPVTQDDPYYEVSVQLKDTVYVGQYTPRHASDTLPDDLQTDSSVEVRLDKHHIYMKRPGGTDLELILVRRNVVKTEQKTQEPAKK